MTMTWERTLNVHVQLDSIECCACGMPFAMPRDYLRNLREKGADHWFYCPAGHQQHFAEGEVARLRKQLEAEQRRSANLREDVAVALAGQRQAEATARKAKRRAANGVCPVPDCRRHFDNLERHMSTEHPGYVHTVSQQAPTSTPPLVTWNYGTMRPIALANSRSRWYQCQCGERVATAHGKARRHARQCKQASQPWPEKEST